MTAPEALPEPDFTLDSGRTPCYYIGTLQAYGDARAQAAQDDAASWEKQASDRVDDALMFAKQADEWKAKYEAARMEADALRAAIDDHNRECVGQCEARKAVGKSSCYMLGYDRECGDCPREGMLSVEDSSALGGTAVTSTEAVAGLDCAALVYRIMSCENDSQGVAILEGALRALGGKGAA